MKRKLATASVISKQICSTLRVSLCHNCFHYPHCLSVPETVPHLYHNARVNQWRFADCATGYKWVRYTGARHWVPGMITIGRDQDGAQLVVARAHHHGDMLPAKAKPEQGIAYVAHGGAEHMKHDFEVGIL